MTATTAYQAMSVIEILIDSVLEAVREAGTLGLPSGPLYAILASQGVSLATYHLLMDALVSAGKIKQRGNLYFAPGNQPAF